MIMYLGTIIILLGGRPRYYYIQLYLIVSIYLSKQYTYRGVGRQFRMVGHLLDQADSSMRNSTMKLD